MRLEQIHAEELRKQIPLGQLPVHERRKRPVRLDGSGGREVKPPSAKKTPQQVKQQKTSSRFSKAGTIIP